MIFTPQNLNPGCRLWQYREHIPEGDKTIYWNYDTLGPRIQTDYNAGCFDVSKRRVHDIHLSALGYTAEVDPMTTAFPFVEKSDGQGKHDLFKVRRKNTTPIPGMVYERLFDNTFEWRYFYCRTGFDFYLQKLRPKGDPQGYKVLELCIVNDRPDYIRVFADAFGVDFCEFDILFQMGRPYIIDVNNVAGARMNRSFFCELGDWGNFGACYILQIESL
ncbi:MAG TPA: hypothetical protein P5531_03880 [Bacteroidales bacterium]|nr:hypothetical protein [Bacteroidales bacterium]